MNFYTTLLALTSWYIQILQFIKIWLSAGNKDLLGENASGVQCHSLGLAKDDKTLLFQFIWLHDNYRCISEPVSHEWALVHWYDSLNVIWEMVILIYCRRGLMQDSFWCRQFTPLKWVKAISWDGLALTKCTEIAFKLWSHLC